MVEDGVWHLPFVTALSDLYKNGNTRRLSGLQKESTTLPTRPPLYCQPVTAQSAHAVTAVGQNSAGFHCIDLRPLLKHQVSAVSQNAA